MEITRLDLPKCQVVEGPVWDEGEQALYYIDILAKKVFRWRPASGEHKSWDVPDIIGSMALREGGGAVVALGNGPCWSPNSRTFYHADSLRHLIYAYDYDIETGRASNRRAFFDSSAYGPIPDGATVDAEGNLWTAICEGGVVLCLSPVGEVLREIAFPTRIPASVMFFGPALDRLFVPTIDPTFLGREAAPDDGCCFVIDGLGVQGLPEPRYAG